MAVSHPTMNVARALLAARTPAILCSTSGAPEQPGGRGGNHVLESVGIATFDCDEGLAGKTEVASCEPEYRSLADSIAKANITRTSERVVDLRGGKGPPWVAVNQELSRRPGHDTCSVQHHGKSRQAPP